METPPVTTPPAVVFKCGACGLSLSVPASMAGTSGPCPSCGAWISSPGTEPLETGFIPAKRQSQPAERRRKGRIAADSIVDHAHLAQRESAQTLKVLALFVIAICACLAVVWFMKDWMGK